MKLPKTLIHIISSRRRTTIFTETKPVTVSFAEMLEDYQITIPHRGQIVNGEVIAMDDETVILDIGAKRDAIVSRQEMSFLSETVLEGLSIGNQLPVYITRTASQDNELLVSIEKGLAQQDWRRAVQYLESKEMLDLKVVDSNSGGLLVAFGRINGFVPNSMITGLPRGLTQIEKQKAKRNFLGKTLHLNVIEVDQTRKRFILSGKAAEINRAKRTSSGIASWKKSYRDCLQRGCLWRICEPGRD